MTHDTESGSTEKRLDRRTMLKSAVATGLAASGFAGSASADHFREITFCSVGAGTFRFRAEVTGEVERGGTYESDRGDTVGDGFVDGAAGEGRCDSFLFTGEIENLDLSGPGKVLVDGEVIRDTTKPEPLSNRIRIQAEGERVEYRFRVTGRVEKAREADPSDEIVDSNVVRGVVRGQGVDVFRYSGDITFDEAEGPLKVTLDIDPADDP